MNIIEAVKAGREIKTRDGKSVRIICTDRKTITDFIIIGLIDFGSYEEEAYYTIDGKISENYPRFDLVIVPKKVTKYMNIYKNFDTQYVNSTLFDSLEYAKTHIYPYSDYIKTIKIEIEE